MERSIQFIDWCLFRLATRPSGGRDGSRTHNDSVLVTSVRLRGVKKWHYASGKKYVLQLNRLCLCHLATPPSGGGGRIRTYNVLVTPGRLRNAKMKFDTRVERSGCVCNGALL